MTRSSTIALAALLALGTACDSTNGPMDGTQVGSEGFRDECGRAPVDGAAAVDGFVDTPQDLADKFLGAFTAVLDPIGGDAVTGRLDLSASDFALPTEDACPEGVFLGVTGQLDVSPLLTVPLDGEVYFPSEGRGEGILVGADPTGDAAPGGFDPRDYDSLDVRLILDVAEDGMTGPADFVACSGSDCMTDSIGELTATPR